MYNSVLLYRLYLNFKLSMSIWVNTIKPKFSATLVLADQIGAWHWEPAVWEEAKDNEVEREREQAVGSCLI